MVRVSGKIRQLLVDAGLVDRETWDAARDQGGNVIETLVEDGKITEDSLLETLGRASSVPPVDVTRVEPDLAALESISQELCAKFGVFPLSRNGEVLTIVVSDPFDVLLTDDLRRRTGCQIRQMVSSPGMIERAIDAAFQTRKREVEELMDEVGATEDLEVSAVEEEAEGLDIASTGAGDDAPAVKLVNMILLRALKEKASDIHVEPTDKHINVRLRVDGRLSRIMTVTRVVLPALISRLKILAQLDIAERFTPQDGKFQIRYEGRQIDFRLSVLPVVGGEKAVLRVLDTGSMSLKLDSMGYESRSLEHIRQAIKSPYGMLLITGPTGSTGSAGPTGMAGFCARACACASASASASAFAFASSFLARPAPVTRLSRPPPRLRARSGAPPLIISASRNGSGGVSGSDRPRGSIGGGGTKAPVEGCGMPAVDISGRIGAAGRSGSSPNPESDTFSSIALGRSSAASGRLSAGG